MRIGLYGLPCAGKDYILERVPDQFRFVMNIHHGSFLLRRMEPGFETASEEVKRAARRRLARNLQEEKYMIMDGHYSFGDHVVFTEEDGELYDAFCYLYIDPKILRKRMLASKRNRKYAGLDLERWQKNEIESLRHYAHLHRKNFYVIDNPEQGYFTDISLPKEFLVELLYGFNPLEHAAYCVEDISYWMVGNRAVLVDGDGTLTVEDTARAVFGYKTHIFDGNFYTGYQTWRQAKDFETMPFTEGSEIPVHIRRHFRWRLGVDMFILTSGHTDIWVDISEHLEAEMYFGRWMCADTKYFITCMLQERGYFVEAYGDSMNDYFMLKQADKGYLIRKPDGSLSRSLKGRDLGGLHIVRIGNDA